MIFGGMWRCLGYDFWRHVQGSGSLSSGFPEGEVVLLQSNRKTRQIFIFKKTCDKTQQQADLNMAIKRMNCLLGAVCLSC